MKATVLGAGSWGTTLALVLLENGHEVTLWTYKPDHVELMRSTRQNAEFLPGIKLPNELTVSSDIVQACSARDLLVAAVPAQYLRSVIEQVAHLDHEETIVCNVAKGIENTSLMTMSEVLLEVLAQEPRPNIVTLSEPSHAEEVCRKIPTAIVAASSRLATGSEPTYCDQHHYRRQAFKSSCRSSDFRE